VVTVIRGSSQGWKPNQSDTCVTAAPKGENRFAYHKEHGNVPAGNTRKKFWGTVQEIEDRIVGPRPLSPFSG
jgi:hypothetical protein